MSHDRISVFLDDRFVPDPNVVFWSKSVYYLTLDTKYSLEQTKTVGRNQA